jgi:hypothetical protein
MTALAHNRPHGVKPLAANTLYRYKFYGFFRRRPAPVLLETAPRSSDIQDRFASAMQARRIYEI